MIQRKIIVHLHLFKNAGTSVDQILKTNFGSRWMAYDEDQAGSIICTEKFEQIIQAHPDVDAFSSHQVVPPFPDADVFVFPIVFIRHPIERIKSAYLFEWKKQLGLDAPKGSLREYVTEKLQKRRRNVIEDFQTMRLSNLGKKKFQNIDQLTDGELLKQAKDFLAQIPCAGVVDRFDQSIVLMQALANEYWPHLKFSPVQENTAQNIDMPILEKVDIIRDELGPRGYQEVIDANHLDLELYEYACQLLNNQWARHCSSREVA